MGAVQQKKKRQEWLDAARTLELRWLYYAIRWKYMTDLCCQAKKELVC